MHIQQSNSSDQKPAMWASLRFMYLTDHQQNWMDTAINQSHNHTDTWMLTILRTVMNLGISAQL